MNRTNLYKTLALIAWAQQGKTLSDKLFENCVTKGRYYIIWNGGNLLFVSILSHSYVENIFDPAGFLSLVQSDYNSLPAFNDLK